jgi:hypothetical protein
VLEAGCGIGAQTVVCFMLEHLSQPVRALAILNKGDVRAL